MGILQSIENEIIKALRLDNSIKLTSILQQRNISKDRLFTKNKRTLIQLCCYFCSKNCLSKLIELNYNINIPELSNNCTPIFIACKFSYIDILKILLSNKNCQKLIPNIENLNEFDIAFLRGNYQICYYLLYEYSNDDSSFVNNNEKYSQIYQNYFFGKNFDFKKFLTLQQTNKYPLFNMPLFFESLLKKIPYDKCESFAPEKKKTKELLNKIPDPNESWAHFFKRLMNFELYNPPLIDKKGVRKMNSLYMSTQIKLIENEYGIKMSYDDNNGNEKKFIEEENKNLKEENNDETVNVNEHKDEIDNKNSSNDNKEFEAKNNMSNINNNTQKIDNIDSSDNFN